ncbi:hypothetical protein NliqN6_0113 [Naganishia liquefaciens]|uniref:Exosome complex protein n=1 Tax=Naganishia liquefaciens TaxID=104408 RepID=A0A8H3YDE4_9TREE|nr:hypothetical protein NliqN6_0113 [Naganishia liquefaciens]
MSSSESEFDAREALDEIDQDIDNLEAVLKPLLSSSWQEVISSLGNLEQAKMNMIMAYGICDLIWIFLRLKGLDPDKHPVMKELDRIKTYYIKVRDAESAPKRANKVDVAAAGRFIAAAIPRAQRLAAETADDNASTVADSSRASTPALEESDVGMASRFKMARDAQSEKLAAEGENVVGVVSDTPKQQVSSAKRNGKRVAAEDFLDEDAPKKTKSGGNGSIKTKKARKSSSKRSS